MVDPVTPADGGTTVRGQPEDVPARGTGLGLGITVLAVGIAVAFGSAAESPEEAAVHVAIAHAAPAESGAPPTDASGAPVGAAFGVRFPNLGPRLGWKPVGRRDDVVDGREVRTLVYGRGGRRLAYSVVAGPPLPPPPGGVRVPVRGPEVVAFDAGGRTAVLVTRGGHSVVVSGLGIPRPAVVRAAHAR